MNQMKYIIFTGTLHAEPVIFPMVQQHDDMAEALKDRCGKPVSAGFVDITDGVMSAHGESDSLGISSRPQDSQIINLFLGIK